MSDEQNEDMSIKDDKRGSDAFDKTSYEYAVKREQELEFGRKRRTLKDLKYIGSKDRNYKKYWMLDDETLLKRAFQTVFGNGLNHRKIDKKRIPPFHLDILIKRGYAKNLPNISCCILTDKAFEDKDKILCVKPLEED
jgi:hypothetical protein